MHQDRSKNLGLHHDTLSSHPYQGPWTAMEEKKKKVKREWTTRGSVTLGLVASQFRSAQGDEAR